MNKRSEACVGGLLLISITKHMELSDPMSNAANFSKLKVGSAENNTESPQ